jgi:hypothetical protein
MRVVMLCAMLAANAKEAHPAIEKYVVYGMYSGLALLMDVHGGRHGDNFQFALGDPRLPDHPGAAVRWFDENL